MSMQMPHPLGTRAKVLLSSVFGPYVQDDEFGSRKINPMELYQNQVTRVQGVFSLRMFHRSFGLMMIQSNIDAPCTLLDFPSLDRFTLELQENKYDIIGISAIRQNIGKVKKMCELIREYQPGAVILVGGHIASQSNLNEMIDSDHIVKGEGVRWFRSYLGQDVNAPIIHPEVYSCNGTRILGYALNEKPGDTAAMLIPSVGCPLGCNFCSTSALFGGKGNFINFYETGDELFSVMCRLEKNLKVRSFFVMDENFLYHRKRALRLLELIEENHKSWALSVFSSARVIKSYTLGQLARLGISWVWMGMEGRESKYSKLSGVDTCELVKQLQSHGIRVLGSSIIGMENHKPENIDEIIEYAVSHDTVFHQFMLYTPNPGTPLYEEHKKDGTLFDESEFPPADAHGQYRFNYKHKYIKNGEEEEYIVNAFKRDFKVNGPSLFRLIRTLLNGWQEYKNHPETCIKDRFAWEVAPLRTSYAGAVWAMKKWYADDPIMLKKINTLLKDIYKEFGLKTRLAAPVIGIYLFSAMKREAARLAQGWTYEPRSFYEKNQAALALESTAAESGTSRTGVNVKQSRVSLGQIS
ncbi:B12-binding radical SAM domain-containing protein [Desulfonema limicola]|uniref:B12-binding radical SAM domain-containing protein n=1 Tax=Desulfonema limicola TaxID=45656 RepID=A0A975B9W1_9BACT|nr:cobalamin-dependent protein [Desulfonema limicola]QTA81458.1 B12-binding radical SAM domain-containing protein [Desulfonema limicola]